MDYLADIAELEGHYGDPGVAATRKVASRIVPAYRTWIERSRFCVLATVGPEGTDASPRGDDKPVVAELDETTLAMPDWMGNNRIDSLRNIVRDGRVSLMLMIPGSTNVVRVNGTARITADEALRGRFAHGGRLPRTVIVVRVGEIYFQCARALIRARLWTSGDESAGLPTAGEILSSVTEGEVGGPAYDDAWPERAVTTMW